MYNVITLIMNNEGDIDAVKFSSVVKFWPSFFNTFFFYFFLLKYSLLKMIY